MEINKENGVKNTSSIVITHSCTQFPCYIKSREMLRSLQDKYSIGLSLILAVYCTNDTLFLSNFRPLHYKKSNFGNSFEIQTSYKSTICLFYQIQNRKKKKMRLPVGWVKGQ